MIDLPGAYSLDPDSLDEAVTRDVVLGARQVDHFNGLAVVKRRPPRFALNRYAGI